MVRVCVCREFNIAVMFVIVYVMMSCCMCVSCDRVYIGDIQRYEFAVAGSFSTG